MHGDDTSKEPVRGQKVNDEMKSVQRYNLLQSLCHGLQLVFGKEVFPGTHRIMVGNMVAGVGHPLEETNGKPQTLLWDKKKQGNCALNAFKCVSD